MEYNGYLMSGNTPAAQIERGKIIPLDISRMPLYLTADGSFEDWLTSRAIDQRRPNARILKKVLHLTNSSDAAAVLRVHGAAITDNYWIRLDGEDALSYEDVRFKTDTFADIALNGSFSSYSKAYEKNQLEAGTPELTNIGSYEKCWRIENDGWWLYKSGSPLERFSELFIARLGKELGFSMAEYLPAGTNVKTPDFTRGIYNYEPVSAIVGDEDDWALSYDRLTALHPALGGQYLDILYMDALCCNVDRHTQNYGVLRDQTIGSIISMAPNFDNNIALIARGYDPDAQQANGFLIDRFLNLLEERGLTYCPPMLDEAVVYRIVQDTLPEENINRDFVAEIVLKRGQKLEHKIEQCRRQKNAIPDMSFS